MRGGSLFCVLLQAIFMKIKTQNKIPRNRLDMRQVVFREWTWQPAMNPKFLNCGQCFNDRSVPNWYEQKLKAVLAEDRTNHKSIPSGSPRLSKILPTKLKLSGSEGCSVFADGPDFLECFDPWWEVKQLELVFRIIPWEFLGGKQSIPDLAGML